MEHNTDNLKPLIDGSRKILVTAHISPDPDAVSSLLLMGTALSATYDDKQVVMSLEERPINLGFLKDYGKIEFAPLKDQLISIKPDLVIMLDGNNFERFSRHDGEEVRRIVAETGIKTITIDHHELDDRDNVDVFINNGHDAAVQDVYNVCFEILALKRPEGYAQTAMVGLYADTGGFAYMKGDNHKQLFSFADELVTNGANIEEIKNSLARYTKDDIEALAHLFSNVSHQDDYNYSFISDEFIDSWLERGNHMSQLQVAIGTFLDQYVRNINDRVWGFVCYKNILNGENMYSASFRAAGKSRDVSKLARRLGGGGHKAASGAKFQANTVTEAINKIKQTILEP